MNPREELEQQLWEFAFDLLTPDDAEAMRERITSDPDAARLYAEVKLQTDIVAEAVRIRHPAIPLTPPGPASEQAASDEALAAQDAKSHNLSINRPANWFVALAAGFLLCYLGHAYFKPRSPLREVAFRSVQDSLANQAVRTTAVGPSQLQRSSDNVVTVFTRTAAGVPRSTPGVYQLCAANGRQVFERGQFNTDDNGVAQFRFAADVPTSDVTLEIHPTSNVSVPPASRTLSVHKRDLSTHLTTDRTIYRPGDTVQFRSVTLSRYDLDVRQEVSMHVKVLGPDGTVVSGLESTVETDRGVGAGSFPLPGAQLSGEHVIVASSPTDEFIEARQEFFVRDYDVPRLKKRLDFDRGSYGPGDQVVVDFSVQRAEGGPAINEPIEVVADVDGRRYVNRATAADDRGRYRFRFTLPEEMQRRDGVIALTVGESERERITKDIPIHTGEVSVEFYPECGDLVSNVENRVYFFARDSLHNPVHVQGTLEDVDGRSVADVQTVRDGRGVFQLTPRGSQCYSLVFDVEGSTRRFPLPPCGERQFLTMNTGRGVYPVGADIELDLRSQQSVRPVLISAVCRGVVVGQEMVPVQDLKTSAEGTHSSRVQLELDDEASGVIRLTAYDCGVDQLSPIAERLVFRHPERKLEIGLEGVSSTIQPADQVDLSLVVTNEQGAAQAAVLGVSVVDEATLSLERDRSASLTTHFWLTGQIDNARGLEDANLYLEESATSDAWLDLLLGTNGWRRFHSAPATQLAADAEDRLYDRADAEIAQAGAALDEPTAPVLLADNMTGAIKAMNTEWDEFVRSCQVGVTRISRILFFGGLALVVSLVLLAIMRRVTATVWIPALGSGALCLVLGAVWMSAQFEYINPLARPWQTDTDRELVLSQVTEAATSGELSEKKTPEKEIELTADFEAEKGLGREPQSPYLRQRNDRELTFDEDRQHEILEQPEADAEVTDEEAVDAYGGRSPSAMFEPMQAMDDMSEVPAAEEAELGDSRPDENYAFDAPEPESMEEQDQPADAGATGEIAADTAAPAPRLAEPLERMDVSRPTRKLAEDDAAKSRAVKDELANRLAREKDDLSRRRRVAEPQSRSLGTMKGAGEDAPAPPGGMGGGAGFGRGGGGVVDAAGGARVVGRKEVRGQKMRGVREQTPADRPALAGQNMPAPASPAAAEGSPSEPEAEEVREAVAQPFGLRPPLMPERAPSSKPEALADNVELRGALDMDRMDAFAPIAPGGPAVDRKNLPDADDSSIAAEGLELQEELRVASEKWKKEKAAISDDRLSLALTDRFARGAYVREYAPRSLTALQRRAAETPPEETVLWQPLIIADENGRSRLQFSLPNVETTYRVLINGHLGGRLGSYRGRIVAKQPDSISPVEIADPQR